MGKDTEAVWAIDNVLQSVRCRRRAGVWDRLLAAVSVGFNGELVMIDSTCVRVHQNGATAKKGDPAIMAWDVPGAALPESSSLLSTLRDVLFASG